MQIASLLLALILATTPTASKVPLSTRTPTKTKMPTRTLTPNPLQACKADLSDAQQTLVSLAKTVQHQQDLLRNNVQFLTCTAKLAACMERCPGGE
jgi:hypothetical protein